MIGANFEYDGALLSDFGFMICSFGKSENSHITTQGSDITFCTVPVMDGKRNLLAGTKYENFIEAEFDICKNCERKIERDYYVTEQEERNIVRWLNRKNFKKFRILTKHVMNVYYLGSFNVTPVQYWGHVIGFHLKFQADSPFGYTDCIFNFTIKDSNEKYSIIDLSDESGDKMINVKIKCGESGTLAIKNHLNKKETIIKNCEKDEIITIENMIIQSSIFERNKTIMNDFNFVFPTISNDFRNVKNIFEFSMPCSGSFKYNARRKVAIG